MLQLHTWVGVFAGGVLFVIFWMGTLSLFDREIDRWMMPDTRLPLSEHRIGLDASLQDALTEHGHRTARLQVQLPTPRAPIMRLSYRDASGNQFLREDINPSTGKRLRDQGTLGGTGFIFPFHFSLHIKWQRIGYWIVGAAAMAMLVLLVSGIITHRKILADFFTFRPQRQFQRSVLDLHNLSGVLLLPFHFVITLSGLIIFILIYFPQAHVGAYGESDAAKAAFTAEALGRFKRQPLQQPAPLASVEAMLTKAERAWSGGKPYLIRIWHPGDENSYVEVRRSYAHDVTMHLDQINFDASTGEVLYRFETPPVVKIQRFISGIHFIQFEHWPLRFLYFLGGLGGCMLIATGLIFWLGARRKRLSSGNQRGLHAVSALATASIVGTILGTASFFVFNRLLPLSTHAVGLERAELEVLGFILAWLFSAIHAYLQPQHAWRLQCRLAAIFAVLAVLLNAWTTGDHLLHTLTARKWSIAGMDLMLLTSATTLLYASRYSHNTKRN